MGQVSAPGSQFSFGASAKSLWQPRSHKRHEVFLPVFEGSVRRQCSLRPARRPLFPGYLFCRFQAGRQVRRDAGRNEEESKRLSQLHSIVNSNVAGAPWKYLPECAQIGIESVLFGRLEGVLIRAGGSRRLVVSSSILDPRKTPRLVPLSRRTC